MTPAQRPRRPYDALKDGSAYLRPAQPVEEPDPAPNLPQDIKDWIDRHLAKERPVAITEHGPIGTDVTDEFIAALEKLEAALAQEEDEPVAVLAWETARQRALAEWKGETRTNAKGRLHRRPELPAVEIGELADGTPVEGHFDTDDTPLLVRVEGYAGFWITADETYIYLIDEEEDREYHDLTFAEYKRLKEIIDSGVLDEMFAFGQAWEAQRPA